MNVERGADFEACFDSGITGFTNIVSLTLIDNDGGIFWPASTADIVESPAGSGVYCANRTAPIILGQYTMVWSLDGTYDPSTVGIENLQVLALAPSQPPLTPIDPDGGAVWGPCSAWTTAEDVAACCGDPDPEDAAIYQSAADDAARLLYELSGRLFAGACEKTVRPCGNRPCGFQVLSRGHIVDPGWTGSYWGWGSNIGCGCQPLDRIKLSGYPVREITEVKIDGDVVDADTYRLDKRRYVTRVRDPADPDTALYWPSCQSLDLDDTEDGTFSISYSYGQDAPPGGSAAAAQLGCELYKACGGGSGDCVLPTGVTRMVRQGVTIEKLAFTSWAFSKGTWRTGMPLVDAFLGAYARTGALRRPTFWSPSRAARYVQSVGQ